MRINDVITSLNFSSSDNITLVGLIGGDDHNSLVMLYNFKNNAFDVA
jgi:hypothetical protein